MTVTFLKSVLHNIGVVLGSLGLAWLATLVDWLLAIRGFVSPGASAVGALLLALGFMLRVWAVVHFYSRRMRVISLEPQGFLVTTGPYRYSRNPLYLGANVFCFFGAALLLGSPTALVLTAVHLPFLNRFIQREERQLEQKFGEDYRAYKKQVRRWI